MRFTRVSVRRNQSFASSQYISMETLTTQLHAALLGTVHNNNYVAYCTVGYMPFFLQSPAGLLPLPRYTKYFKRFTKSGFSKYY